MTDIAKDNVPARLQHTAADRKVYLYAFKDQKGGYQLSLYHDEPPTPWQLRHLPEVMGKTLLTDGWQFKNLTEIVEEHNRRLREKVDWWPDNTMPPPLSAEDKLKAQQENMAKELSNRKMDG